ncbi:putative iron-sulfur cluster-binding metallochaperone [Shewanella gelidii]|uniref:putative iron-sulfur cluster-binding metallochaperone n=1 Tax=Shewanella gelidii TaxID=1642821 RepID=UPI00166AA68B
MTSCCSENTDSSSAPKTHRCPVDGELYSRVPMTTILHHIHQPWMWHAKPQGYYFCSNPHCDVVYFGEDNSVLTKSSLRTKVGVKDNHPNSLICYCFGVSRAESKSQDIKAFVVRSTREKKCACTARNPSGRCCLKDFR